MPDDFSPSPTRAMLHWIVLSLVFIFAGGLGAGATALLYDVLFPRPFGDVLYAVLFGGIGWIGVRAAQPLVTGTVR